MLATRRISVVPLTAAAMLVAVATAGIASDAPVIVQPASGAAIGSSAVRIAGTAPGWAVAVRVVEGTTALGETGATGGTWSIDLTLADGSHTIVAEARTASGPWGASSMPVTFVVDTVAPSTPTITAPASGSLFAFSSFTVEGTADPGERVELLPDTGGVHVATASSLGRWQIAATWTDATHTLRARAVDAAGNHSALSAPVTVTVDTRPPPAPRIDSPVAGTLTNRTALLVRGAAEPGATVTIFESAVLAHLTAGPTGAWETSLTFSEGSHAIRARATDPAGNVGEASPVVAFTIDTTAPAAPVIDAPLEGARVAPQHAVLQGIAEPNATVELLRNAVVVASTRSSPTGSWSIPLPSPSEGSVSVVARARDDAGNTSALSAMRTFSVDATPPTITIGTPPGSIFLPPASPRIDGTADDASGIFRVTVDFYDVSGRGIASFVASCARCPAGDVTWVLEQTPLVGRFVVRAQATDVVGNKSAYVETTVTIVRRP